MQVGRMFGRRGRSIQGPFPPRFTDRLQNVLQLRLRTHVRPVLALAVQPIRVDAPVVSAEELGQVEALGQQAVDLILRARLNPVNAVTLREGHDERECGLFDRGPEVMPRYP